jgi:hypothetical protein
LPRPGYEPDELAVEAAVLSEAALVASVDVADDAEPLSAGVVLLSAGVVLLSAGVVLLSAGAVSSAGAGDELDGDGLGDGESDGEGDGDFDGEGDKVLDGDGDGEPDDGGFVVWLGDGLLEGGLPCVGLLGPGLLVLPPPVGGVVPVLPEATSPKTRVAAKNSDHQTVEIFTTSPVCGAWTILPSPRYIPTWCTVVQSFGLVAKKIRSPGSSAYRETVLFRVA